MDRSREPLEGMLLTGHRTKSGCPDTLSQSGAYLAYLHQDVTGMLLVTQLLGVGASAELERYRAFPVPSPLAHSLSSKCGCRGGAEF